MNSLLGELCGASSAGTRLAGFIRLLAIRVLQEIGIDHSASSKGIDGLRHTPCGLVVTALRSALEERSVWPGSGNRVHPGYPDPAEAAGSEVEVISAFRQGRDRIDQQVPSVLASSVELHGTCFSRDPVGGVSAAPMGLSLTDSQEPGRASNRRGQETGPDRAALR